MICIKCNKEGKNFRNKNKTCNDCLDGVAVYNSIIEEGDVNSFELLIALTRANNDDKEVMVRLTKKYINKRFTMCYSCKPQVLNCHGRLKTFYEQNKSR